MNKKAILAIIGIILMVAITCAVACTVYFYISGVREQQEQPEYISGNLTNIQLIEENKFFITLDNDSYIVKLTRHASYSFTIGNFYLFKLSYDTFDGTPYIKLVVEINAVH